MQQATIDVQVPRSLLEFGLTEQEVQQRVVEWLVLSLFTEGRVSSGKAAHLLHISRLEFLTLLRERGVAYIDFSPAELEDELQAAEKLRVHSRS